MPARDRTRSGPDSAEGAFGAVAAEYDAWARRALPTFEALMRAAVDAVPFDPGAALEVADLGAGTGLFSAWIAARHPAARFTLTDASEEMLEVARRRFAGEPGRFAFAHERLQDFRADARFDLVVSRLAIHHLSHPEKRSLFRAVHAALRPGGAFLNMDQVRADPPFDAFYWNEWLAKVRAAGAPEPDVRASIERRLRFDRDASLAEQLAWLEAAGFRADCVEKHRFVAVFVALKPGGGAPWVGPTRQSGGPTAPT